MTIGGSRLLLNLRSAYFKQSGFGFGDTTLGEITGGLGDWAVKSHHSSKGTVTGSIGVWVTPNDADDGSAPEIISADLEPTNHDRQDGDTEMETFSPSTSLPVPVERVPIPIERWRHDVPCSAFSASSSSRV